MRSALVLLCLALAAPASALELEVSAQPPLEGLAARVRAIDTDAVDRALAGAGLALPPVVRISLVPNADPVAASAPPWVVGLAFGREDIVIFPERVGSYPYDSLESVVTHEIAHLALNVAAGGGALPRWFHEGVAVSVESGWGITGGTRLLLAAFSEPRLDDLRRLFASESQLGNADAYLLATALVEDVRERHGAAVPGAIAGRVAAGIAFPRAFELETGETPDTAAERAWAGYRRWTRWLPIVTDPWSFIVLLALLAFAAQRRRRAERRRQWDDEDGRGSGSDGRWSVVDGRGFSVRGSDHQPPTTDDRPPTTDHRPPTIH
ncbi:MAG: hypothetical protein AB7P99_10450 [Vicinamibacterales bacterium]